MVPVIESVVEEAALAWLADLGYTPIFGPDIAPGEACAERDSYGDGMQFAGCWQEVSMERAS